MTGRTRTRTRATAALTGVACALLITSAGALPALALQQTSSRVGPPPAKGHFTPIIVPGGRDVTPEGISDSGLIVGCDQRPAGMSAFTDLNGKFAVLRDPAAGPKGTTCAFSVNSADTIVGYYGQSTIHGFVYANQKFTTINAPGAGHGNGDGTYPVDINDSGVVVGRYTTADFVEHGFVLKNGKFTTITYPGPAHAKHPDTVLTGISDSGTITGIYINGKGNGKGNGNGNGTTISFRYRAGRFTKIVVPHAFVAEVACISKHQGLIVGVYQTSARASSAVGFVDHAGVLRSLRDPAATDGTNPQCGNDSGLIVGFYLTPNQQSHGFLFTPGHGAPESDTRGHTAPESAPPGPQPSHPGTRSGWRQAVRVVDTGLIMMNRSGRRVPGIAGPLLA